MDNKMITNNCYDQFVKMSEIPETAAEVEECIAARKARLAVSAQNMNEMKPLLYILLNTVLKTLKELLTN